MQAPDRQPRHGRMRPDEKVVVSASGFTSLWAISWLGAEALAASAAVQGGFAVGGVMAGSGLAALWWRTRAMQALAAAGEESEHKETRGERDDPRE